MVIRNVREGRNSSSSRRSTAEYTKVVQSSHGIGSCRNGKKGIRRYQEDFTRELKLH
jgi:hypothetical protein